MQRFGEIRGRRLALRAAAISAAARLLFPSVASADQTAGVGLYLGIAFEAGRPGISWGLEGFATHLFEGEADGCSSAARSGIGPVLSVGVIGVHAPRVTLAAFLGQEIPMRGALAIGGELGLTGRFGDEAGLGLHTALVPSLAYLNARLGAEWGLNEFAATGGIRFPSSYGTPGMCAEGRPFRDGAGNTRLGTVRRAAPIGRTTHASACSELIEAWAADSRAECASIAAFIQLAMELLSLGAPDELVERVLDAAEEEIKHAASVAELASRSGEFLVQPVYPEAPLRPTLRGTEGWIRLALESWTDGCIGEGLAALRACSGARTARDPHVRKVRERIAREEHGHAELGWTILDFALARGGEPVREALADARDSALELERTGVDEPAEFAVQGRVSSRRFEALADLHSYACRARLDARLRKRTNAHACAI
ncbi:MAG TPA: hypothetical protein VIM73_05635 [Polyangiaceae bacterium]